jgi:hypothetical protein
MKPKLVPSLLIGEYREDGKLYHIKRLIADSTSSNRPEIFRAVQNLKIKKMPFVNLREKNYSTNTQYRRSDGPGAMASGPVSCDCCHDQERSNA